MLAIEFELMSIAILLLLVLLLLWGRPCLVKELPLNGGCMTHDRTNLINAFFIVIVVLRHINQRIVPFHGIDTFYCTYFDGPSGQAIVSSFFFFSGYGIFKSIQSKGATYVRDLMRIRFVRLYITTAICCAVSGCVYAFVYLTPEEALLSYIKTLLGMGGAWFIIMTLAIYIIVWFSFKICSIRRPLLSIGMVFVLTFALCVSLIRVKPSWWLDTELCFPCGMLMALYLPQIEQVVRKIRLPIMLVGMLFVCVGWVLMRHHMIPARPMFYHLGLMNLLNGSVIGFLLDAYHIFIYPLCTVVWVLGILWIFAGIQWQRVSRFLVWLGGPAVCYIFLLHFIPLRIIQAGKLSGPYPILSKDIGAKIITEPMGWGAEYPELSIIAVIFISLLLAYVAHLVISRFNKRVFFSNKP